MTTITTPSPRRRILAAAIVSLTVLSAASTARAAVITWSAAQGITGDSDVSTNGTLVGALNHGNLNGPPVLQDTTINGVTFLALGDGNNGATSHALGDFTLSVAGTTFGSFNGFGTLAGTFAGLSANYQTLLASSFGSNAVNAPMTLTMAGLAIGQTYEFQFWANNSNGFFTATTAATAGNSVTLDWNVPDVSGAVGQFAIGTFIADNTSQLIEFNSPTSSLVMNGFQLRNISVVPEPSTSFAMPAICLSFILLNRRRK